MALLPLCIAGNSMIRITRDELKSAANDEIARVAEAMAREVGGLFEDGWVAPLRLVARAIDNPDLGGEQKISLLRAGLANLKDVVACQISVVGIPGPVVVSRDDFASGLIGAGLDPAEVLTVPAERVAEMLSAGSDAIAVGPPELVGATGQWLLTVLVPLERAIAGRQAVLVARIELGGMSEMILSHPFAAAGRIEVVDAEGRRLLDAERQDLSGLAIVAEAIERLQTTSRAIGVRPYRRGDGEVMLAAYAIPRGLPWAVVVERSERDAYRAVRRMNRNLGLMALGGLGLAVLGGFWVALRISRPVEHIADVARLVGGGDLEVAADEPRRRDELADLAVEINHMIRGLKERDLIRDTFGRYVSPGVAQQVLDDPEKLRLGGDLREVTVMMSDLRGFTSLSESLSPAEMVELLNEYLGRMADIIERHGGTVIEFIGDGIMTLFGAPFAHDDDPLRAVACAARMQEELERFNAEHAPRGLPELQMGIGINTGSVIVGNIGNESRMKYGVVGDDVNLAGRIESFTVGGEVLVSEGTRRAVADAVTLRGPIEVKAKGKSATLQLYAVVEVGPPYHCSVPAEQRAPESLLTCTGEVLMQQVRGKEVTERRIEAQLVGLGRTTVEVVVGEPLDVLDNVRLKVSIATPARVVLGNLYAKVVGVEQDASAWRCDLRLTSVPESARQHLDRLLGEVEPSSA
jgi:adenylate cyclase